MKSENCKVYVALSGGVDSSVTAHLLQEQGHRVSGVFIRAWQADFLPCAQGEEERAAKRVAAYLGIPFHTLDLSKEYKKDIVDPMIESFRQGKTPNPDVLCNRYIKFGPFRTWAAKEGADYIATGHHARIVHDETDGHKLLRGVDPSKDQAYFLWMLTQEDLAGALMPIGEMTKNEVRSYARAKKLPSAYKKDSQGLCFLGDVQMRDFLRHFIEVESGSVLNVEGKEIGTHDGALLYTLGQRVGLHVHEQNQSRPNYYVIGKDIKNNTLTVTSAKERTPKEVLTPEIFLKRTNWIMSAPQTDTEYTCEIRYHGERHPCTITLGVDNTATVCLSNPILKVAAEQSVVVYNNETCLGGGMVIE